MRYLVIFFVCFWVHSVSAQYVTFRVAIGNDENDLGACARETYDHGFIVAGTTGSVENTNADIYLFKLDSAGGLKWSKHLGTSTGTENGKKVIQTPDSGYIVVGYSNSAGEGGYDMYAVKTDSVGEVLWSKSYGGMDWDFAYDIAVLPNGNFGIVGSTYSFGNGNSDVYYVEIDDDGNEVFSKTYGGTGAESGNAILLTTDNKLFIAGNTSSFGNGYDDAYIIKAELNGDTIWTKTYGGDSTDYFADIIATTDNNYLAVGGTVSFNLTTKDHYFVKIGAAGNVVYERHDGGPGEEECREVATAADGTCSILGYTTSDGAGERAIQLFQVNSGGWWVNSPQYGSAKDEDGVSVQSTHDNGFVIAGITNGYNAVNYDVLVIKTDSIGHTGLTGDVTNITDDLVGVSEVIAGDIKFYVSINESTISVSSANKQIAAVSVMNLSGQMIFQKQLSHPSDFYSFDIGSVSTGLYFIKTDFKDNYTKTIKVLIKQ